MDGITLQEHRIIFIYLFIFIFWGGGYHNAGSVSIVFTWLW